VEGGGRRKEKGEHPLGHWCFSTAKCAAFKSVGTKKGGGKRGGKRDRVIAEVLILRS